MLAGGPPLTCITTDPSRTYTKVCALCRCSFEDAPGAYSTVTMVASLPGIPRSFVKSGVTFASWAAAVAAIHIRTSALVALLLCLPVHLAVYSSRSLPERVTRKAPDSGMTVKVQCFI